MTRLLSTLKSKWPEYFLEVIVIMIGILSAYSLNNWQESKANHNEELKILREIKSNLELDLLDLNANIKGHKSILKITDSLYNYEQYNFSDAKVGISISNVFRDFIFINQTGAFETLKSKGVSIIQNDSLRMKILYLYDFNLEIMTYLEGEYAPSQLYDDSRYIIENYYNRFKVSKLSPVFVPKQAGKTWLKNPDILIRLDNSQTQRRELLQYYDIVLKSINETIKDINQELEDRS